MEPPPSSRDIRYALFVYLASWKVIFTSSLFQHLKIQNSLLYAHSSEQKCFLAYVSVAMRYLILTHDMLQMESG